MMDAVIFGVILWAFGSGFWLGLTRGNGADKTDWSEVDYGSDEPLGGDE